MPNRILHESIKYCPKMEQLNWFEEVVYHRLTVSVDDYGCLDGRIVLLKNTLFPTREDISKDDIARAIEHMVRARSQNSGWGREKSCRMPSSLA